MSADPPKIVVLDGATTVTPDEAGGPTWEPIAALGELTVHDRTPPEAIAERVDGAEVVIVNKTFLRREHLDDAAFDGCRLIALLSTGTNAVDLGAATDRGITVCNVGGYSTASVAQHVFALVLAFTNRVGEHGEAVQAGRWSGGVDFTFSVAPLVELDGRTLGVVGFGDIGQRVARIAHALGMRVLVQSRTRKESPVPVEWVERERLFAEADVIALHSPLADHPLIGCPNCIVTPHIAWATGAARTRLVEEVAANIAAFLADEPRNVVS